MLPVAYNLDQIMYSKLDLINLGFISPKKTSAKFPSIYADATFEQKKSCTSEEWKTLPLHIQVCYSYAPKNGVHSLIHSVM